MTSVSIKIILIPTKIGYVLNIDICIFLSGLVRQSAAFTGIESKTTNAMPFGTENECVSLCQTKELCKVASLHITSKTCYTSAGWLEYNFNYNPDNRFAIRKGNFSKNLELSEFAINKFIAGKFCPGGVISFMFEIKGKGLPNEGMQNV